MNDYLTDSCRKARSSFRDACANDNNDDLEVYVYMSVHAPMSSSFEIQHNLAVRHYDPDWTYGECALRGPYFKIRTQITASLLDQFYRDLKEDTPGFQRLELTEHCGPSERRQYGNRFPPLPKLL